jgi:hypothetical protein
MPLAGRGKGKGGSAKVRRLGTVPGVPTGVAITDVGTSRAYNNGAVTVTFTAASDGSTPATSYTATASTGQTATGTSSPLTITGIATGANPTVVVKATNSVGDSANSAPSSSVTVTTVPQAPSAPSVSSPTPSAGVNQAGTTTDSVSWSAPANNGGKAISNYEWASSDNKSGTTTGTSVSVNQEGGTSQTYKVRTYNANGWSEYSANSSSVTTFSFSPFSVFSFSPFSVFGFSPFSVFGFSPFGVFGFSPFGFSPFGVFGFSPFGVFGFSPFGFSPFGVFGFSPFSPGSYFGGFFWSLAPHTKVRMADGTLKEAQDVVVGDVLLSADLPGLGENFTTEDVIAWTSGEIFDAVNATTTTVQSVTSHPSSVLVDINGDTFTDTHLILVKRDESIFFKFASQVQENDLVWNYGSESWDPITSLSSTEVQYNSVTINCEPHDVFFTEKTLTHDGSNYQNNQ